MTLVWRNGERLSRRLWWVNECGGYVGYWGDSHGGNGDGDEAQDTKILDERGEGNDASEPGSYICPVLSNVVE